MSRTPTLVPLQLETALPLPPRLLAALAIDHASVARFASLTEPGPGERTSARVRLSSTHDIWLILWGAGSRTVMHDHGGSAGALYVVAGELVEHRPGRAGGGKRRRRELARFEHRAMAPDHVHAIVNESAEVSASIHAYSPPLETMQHYDLTDESDLRLMQREIVEPQSARPVGSSSQPIQSVR